MINSKLGSAPHLKLTSLKPLVLGACAAAFLYVAPSFAQQQPPASFPAPSSFSYNPSDFFRFDEEQGEDSSSSSAAQQAAGLSRTLSLPGQRQGSGNNNSSLTTGGAQIPGMLPGSGNLTDQVLDDIKEETRRQAFDAALEGLLPLRPEEIRTLLERYDRTQESVELPVYPAPVPRVAVETLSLDPSNKPKTISVSHGYVTTFTVVDSTGSPWPIEDITWAGDFEIMEAGGESNHLIRITPRSEFAYGNMSMRLIGLQTPIILSLETARDYVHYRFDAIVPEVGPMAEIPIIESGVTITAGDSDMVRVLEGATPMGAKKLEVSGTDNRTSAYTLNGVTYLRTPLSLLSPAWMRSTSSSDGMRVYAMSEAPVVLLSDKGRTVRVRLSRRGEY